MERVPRSRVKTTRAAWIAVGGVRWLFDTQAGPRNRFVARWIFLRTLAAIYFSAFYSLLFQIEGLNGPHGILPVQRFLLDVQSQTGPLRYWYVPRTGCINASER
jgi:hypothetical protein